MKKVMYLSLVLVMFLGLFSSSFSLLQLKGVYTGYAKGSGIGLGVDFPLIPFIPTCLYVTGLPDTNVSLPSLSMGGINFSAGTAKFKTMTFELQTMFPLDIAGVGVGGSLVMDWLSADLLGKSASFPGNIYGGVVGNYKQNIIPLVDWFAQVGFLVKLWDVEKVIKDANSSIPANLINLSDLDRSGLFYRVGVSIGL